MLFLRSLRLIIDFFFFEDRKKSDLLPQNDLHLFEKVRSYKKNDGCHFSDFGSFLEGRLRPENGSDWAENLTRFVSDKSAKKVFLARFFFFSGCQFSDFCDFLEGRLPSEDGSDRAENLTRSVSSKVAKKIFLARQKKSGCHFSNFPSILGFLQFERFDIWASCSSSVLTF